jgi:hypothetical protein
MVASRDDAIIQNAETQQRPALVVCVNLQNFKSFNTLLGYQKADRFLERVEHQLGEIGSTWRTGGNEFVTIGGGTPATVSVQVRAFSWLFHTTIGATEAWSFSFADGRRSSIVPWRSFEVVCTPRCGIAELGTDVSESLKLARGRCDDLRQATASPDGFAPLTVAPWANQKDLAAPTCPDCGHPRPAILEEDLGWSREHCPRCDARYERSNVMSVLGEVFEAGYM